MSSQPVVSPRVCSTDIDSNLPAHSVTLNNDPVHHINRNKCENKINSVSIPSGYKDRFNFVRVDARGLLDGYHLDELRLLLNANNNINSIAATESWSRTSTTEQIGRYFRLHINSVKS